MKTLTTLSIALVMALALSGPVFYTSTPAHAQSWADYNFCWIWGCGDEDLGPASDGDGGVFGE
ncbi:MAG: hypothetical protein V6Z81_02510 [Parvularculales bacterium]